MQKLFENWRKFRNEVLSEQSKTLPIDLPEPYKSAFEEKVADYINSYKTGAHRDAWLRRLKDEFFKPETPYDLIEQHYDQNIFPQVPEIFRNTPVKSEKDIPARAVAKVPVKWKKRGYQQAMSRRPDDETGSIILKKGKTRYAGEDEQTGHVMHPVERFKIAAHEYGHVLDTGINPFVNLEQYEEWLRHRPEGTEARWQPPSAGTLKGRPHDAFGEEYMDEWKDEAVPSSIEQKKVFELIFPGLRERPGKTRASHHQGEHVSYVEVYADIMALRAVMNKEHREGKREKREFTPEDVEKFKTNKYVVDRKLDFMLRADIYEAFQKYLRKDITNEQAADLLNSIAAAPVHKSSQRA